jgi:hypothetical protein
MGRVFCQNGRHSKSHAKLPPANIMPNENIFVGKTSPTISLFLFFDNADTLCRISEKEKGD